MWLKDKRIFNQRGDSLIEVVIVAFFLASLFTALVSLVIVSVARNRLAKEQAVATRLAQEGMEWLRNQRDEMGFDSFLNQVSSSGGYCLNDILGTFSIEKYCGDECSTCSIPLSEINYIRYAVMNEVDPGESITIEMHVKWNDKDVVQTGVLNKWQR